MREAFANLLLFIVVTSVMYSLLTALDPKPPTKDACLREYGPLKQLNHVYETEPSYGYDV